MYGFCNVWMRVSVGFVMCGCSDNFVGVLVVCILVFTAFLYCFIYVYLFLFVTGVRTTATE
jgi:cyanate permease